MAFTWTIIAFREVLGEDERTSREPMWRRVAVRCTTDLSLFSLPAEVVIFKWTLWPGSRASVHVCVLAVCENTGSPGAGHPPSVAEGPLLRRVRLVKLEEGILRTGNIPFRQTRIISHLARTTGDE